MPLPLPLALPRQAFDFRLAKQIHFGWQAEQEQQQDDVEVVAVQVGQAQMAHIMRRGLKDIFGFAALKLIECIFLSSKVELRLSLPMPFCHTE